MLWKAYQNLSSTKGAYSNHYGKIDGKSSKTNTIEGALSIG
jgi:hypothetical protein